uniref:VWFA domain-containing protein n=1 Tax=Sinocyclocheilus rhinocerous TaxID=307959 RepID=A0A673KV80_9TELE
MFRGLLFMIVIWSVTGFNIQITPVKHFKEDDPLFGQTIIQSTDGVFVPSPKNGALFRCTLQDECIEVNSDDEKPKGLRPVVSVSSLTSEEEQYKVLNEDNEDLKFTSVTVNVPLPSKSALLSPATNQMENKKFNSNNNNNNHYRGGRIEEDAGTEIAFVLDGSGSIQHDDFRRAKDFIYNVMFNVWNTCFDCNFAIVQYGSKIRTELSLLDNDNGAKTLQKVKEIQQIYNLTKTASAIHHVLTDIFIPENGSKIDSKKIIIVLSDGEILGDNMILSDVLNMPQMKGVTRYSIGVSVLFTVGDGILKKPKAIQEMTDIADRGKFFNVSNYAALDDILSSLQQSLIGIEGKKVFSKHYAVIEIGSLHSLHAKI